MRHLHWAVTAAAVLATGVALAQAPEAKKDERQPVTSEELRYQAGSSPLAGVEMHQDIHVGIIGVLVERLVLVHRERVP